MDYEKNDIVGINNKKYLVLDVIRNRQNTYLYLINNDEFENDVSIIKVNDNNGVTEFSEIENEEEFDFILAKLFIDYKSDIEEFIEE